MITMDDIDYLLKHSENDSTMLILDSSNRDRSKHPSPSNYVVEFTEPFRFVYGFDVIDATIPSAMYTIDVHNNLMFFTVFSHISYVYEEQNIHDLFRQRLATCPKLVEIYKKQDIVGKISFVFCQNSIIVPEDTVDDCYIAIEDQLVRISQSQFDTIIQSENYDFAIDVCKFEIEIGNYNIITLQAYLKKYMKPYNIDVRAASLEQRVDKHLKLRFVHYDIVTGYSNPFFLDMSKSTVKDVLGFDELPADSEKKMYKKQSYSLLNSENVFAATKNDTEQVYDVTPPGVVNLLGVRYLTMRCPEIESHLLGSIGFGNADVGLGIFKIPSPYETANLKFDFFNFVKKPFHPIGKLTKLSIRFEREPNVLYDFRGLNHHILVTLKYYVPAMNNDLTNTTPILNPNYNPDFLKYIVEREEVLNDDEDDDDDYEDVTQESLLERYVYYKS